MAPEQIIYYLTLIPAILVAITFHEFAHAWTALKFGDTTAQEQGRVTLNPLAHLDPIGTLAIIFIGFGWGKPVPVNSSRLTHPRADLIVSAAGPTMNLVLAFLGGLPMRIPGVVAWLDHWQLGDGARMLLPAFVFINVALAVFNFIPIGSLDGAHVLEYALPRRLGMRFAEWNRRYGHWLLLLLILSSYVTPVSIISLVLKPVLGLLLPLFLGA